MIQRIIYTALQQGVSAVQADLTLLDELFGDLYGLSSDEVSGIKKYIKANPLKIVHSYPRQGAEAPIYSIVLSNEQQTEWFLSDDMGMESDTTDPNYGADIQGAIWTHTYQIMCFAQNADVTTYMYEIAKQSMHAADSYFLAQDLLEWQFSGMDLAPDPRYAPSDLFCRSMGITAKREFARLDRSSRLGKAFAVTGIAVPPQPGQDNGGALAFVTPYVADPPSSDSTPTQG